MCARISARSPPLVHVKEHPVTSGEVPVVRVDRMRQRAVTSPYRDTVEAPDNASAGSVAVARIGYLNALMAPGTVAAPPGIAF